MNRLLFTPAMVGLMALTLLFSSWGTVLAADTTEMVLIPKGEFTMGSKDHSDEMTHQVVLDGYYIDKYEVSNAQYRDFMKATDHPAPAYWDDPRLNKLGPTRGRSELVRRQLPTVNGWANGCPRKLNGNTQPKGLTGPISPGDTPSTPPRRTMVKTWGKPCPCNAYPDGVSGYGVYNMAGNVFEWVSDWYEPNYFQVSPAFNPQGPNDGYNFANQGPVKVLKGGSWLAPQTSLHTSHRFWNQPENNSYGVGLGFRCALSAGTNAGDMMKYDFMHALISMGKEQWNDALESIDQAIKGDPNNMEYKQTRDIIMKQIKM